METKNGLNTLVAVAIDRDKASQIALKWAIDNLLLKGQTVVLLHVRVKTPTGAPDSGRQQDAQNKDFFLPFRCFCSRKYIQCKDVILEETDVARAIIDYVTQSAIEILIMGSASKGGFLRFTKVDLPSTISKGVPNFCSVYIISKGKVSSMRPASRQAPQTSTLRTQIMNTPNNIVPPSPSYTSVKGSDRFSYSGSTPNSQNDPGFRSPFAKGGHPYMRSFGELSADSDIMSSGRTSVSSFYGSFDPSQKAKNRLSTSSGLPPDYPFDILSRKSTDTDFSAISDVPTMSWASSQTDEMESEMRKLKLDLKQTQDMYSMHKDALTAKQIAMQRRSVGEESAGAIEAAGAERRPAELEARKQKTPSYAENKSNPDAEEHSGFGHSEVNYRKYTIEEIEFATERFAPSRKIGEGGYGPVFRGRLDHTQVAIKVLRPDAAQGRSQFQQEVKVLSCIRHPNMVLLLGACPEYGCLVYEYMHNGSLDDRLFCKGGTPPIPWQHRFRIAAEIATALLFLHQTKPEPLVHRDLKPANILLDRNLVSKISDVGLARLVPPSLADSVTQYRMTSTAGTFCYIDPEYQQTGMLGVKSDVYSLGILLLQIITAKPPMGLTHHVERAIEMGRLGEMLDPTVEDWPVEECKSFAEISLKCAELRRKDRPDLGSVVLPELNRLREIGEDSLDAQGS